jgi:hypothetical protein
MTPAEISAVKFAFHRVSDLEDTLLSIAGLAHAMMECANAGGDEKDIRAIVTCGRIVTARLGEIEDARGEVFSALHPLVFPGKIGRPCA